MIPSSPSGFAGHSPRRAIAAVLVAALLWLGAAGAAFAQASVAMWCWNPTGSSATNNQYLPCNAANPLVVSATIAPSGTQNVNLTQILGAAPSASNPLWILPGTGANLANETGGNLAAILAKLGPSSSSAIGITPVVSGSAVSGLVLKASAGNLYGAYVDATVTGWLMMFNSTAVPSNGATTAGTASGNLVHCVGPSAQPFLSFGSGPPEVYSVGISAAFSSTGCGTLTLSATAFIHGAAQ